MPTVFLHPITLDNWKECINLRPDEAQARFLPSNLYSIAEAQFYPEAQPRAIYNEEEQMVGFVLYGRDLASDKWKVFRLMIDQAYQGRGYGYAAMQAVIGILAARADCDEILISYQRDNDRARRLYARLGFVEKEMPNGHFTASLKVDRPARQP